MGRTTVMDAAFLAAGLTFLAFLIAQALTRLAQSA
jgi:hypothetical protein